MQKGGILEYSIDQFVACIQPASLWVKLLPMVTPDRCTRCDPALNICGQWIGLYIQHLKQPVSPYVYFFELTAQYILKFFLS